jgi:hypothetical protein
MLLVHDQLGAELLQGALGERADVQFHPAGHLPLQIVGCSPLGLVVRNAVIGLEHEGGGQQAGRDTRTTSRGVVEGGEILVAEDLSTMAGEKGVERVPTHEIEIHRVGFEQPPLRPALSQHPAPPPVLAEKC